MAISFYITKKSIIRGTNYKEVYQKAYRFYLSIRSKSKRRAYVRSTYFDKEKIFLQYFWDHIHQKVKPERIVRVQYFICAVDLIENSRSKPTIRINPENNKEIFYRFYGKTAKNNVFYVQIKENLKRNQKYFMSVFPEKRSK